MRRSGKNSAKLYKRIAWVLTVFLLLSAMSLGLNFWVYHELQVRLKIQMKGKYIPAIFFPSFEVQQGAFSWKDKVRLVDGNFKVTFDPLTLISQRGIRVILTSHSSRVQFLGDWALQQGVENATIDFLVADVILGQHGISGINEVDVRSQSFQFSFKNADKIITQKP